jgi:hypothetical protein
MKRNLIFLNPRTFSKTHVRVGIDHVQLLAGVLAAFAKLYMLMSVEPMSMLWIFGLIAVAHLRFWRHAFTLPVIASAALALMSFGLSMVISALIINKMVAQHYRDAGWKIRNRNGVLGEYSSRFLAVHELGFSDSDMTESAALHPR